MATIDVKRHPLILKMQEKVPEIIIPPEEDSEDSQSSDLHTISDNGINGQDHPKSALVYYFDSAGKHPMLTRDEEREIGFQIIEFKKKLLKQANSTEIDILRTMSLPSGTIVRGLVSEKFDLSKSEQEYAPTCIRGPLNEGELLDDEELDLLATNYPEEAQLVGKERVLDGISITAIHKLKDEIQQLSKRLKMVEEGGDPDLTDREMELLLLVYSMGEQEVDEPITGTRQEILDTYIIRTLARLRRDSKIYDRIKRFRALIRSATRQHNEQLDAEETDLFTSYVNDYDTKQNIDNLPKDLIDLIHQARSQKEMKLIINSTRIFTG